MSTERGRAPRWRPDGRALFYDRTGRMMMVDVVTRARSQFKAGVPRPLFQGLRSLGPHNYDVAADGRRFVIIAAPNAALGGPPPITVVIELDVRAEVTG